MPTSRKRVSFGTDPEEKRVASCSIRDCQTSCPPRRVPLSDDRSVFLCDACAKCHFCDISAEHRQGNICVEPPRWVCVECSAWCVHCRGFFPEGHFQNAEDENGSSICAKICCSCEKCPDRLEEHVSGRYYCLECVNAGNAYADEMGEGDEIGDGDWLQLRWDFDLDHDDVDA